jgi:endonuclease/exonuclease/phosphatase family metal-dependent hydrolase
MGDVYDRSPKNDVKKVLGDKTAQIGQEHEYEPTILHTNTNDNGSRLIQFAVSHNMSIGCTMFPHKIIHKPTWRSPDFSVENQIDHVLIDTRHRSNLMDVRTFKGANVDSDHFLVAAKIRALASLIFKS